MGAKLSLEVDVNNALNDTLYEVILKLGVTVQTDDEVAFLIEIQQAGVFVLQDSMMRLWNTSRFYVPKYSFPYARETIDSLLLRQRFAPCSRRSILMLYSSNESSKRQTNRRLNLNP